LGNDSLKGGAGNDFLNGGAGNDTLEGNDGNDTYWVNSTADRIIENGTGTDTVMSTLSWTLGANLETLILSGREALNGTGNNLNNRLTGSFGNNVLSGLGGNDTLIGNGGNDQLLGGNGNDELISGAGQDTLTGGAGADRFNFYSSFYSRRESADTIADFQVGVDQINISVPIISIIGPTPSWASNFSNFGLTPDAAITADQFYIGPAAADADDRVIYNDSTGGLFLDADGTGSTAQVQIATLQTGLNMTSADIFVNPSTTIFSFG
jgi:Ca2+-binding RTX toxin-like protein